MAPDSIGDFGKECIGCAWRILHDCDFDMRFPAGLFHPARVGLRLRECISRPRPRGAGPPPLEPQAFLSANKISMFWGGQRASMPAPFRELCGAVNFMGIRLHSPIEEEPGHQAGFSALDILSRRRMDGRPCPPLRTGGYSAHT